jgi:hypothetical protein
MKKGGWLPSMHKALGSIPNTGGKKISERNPKSQFYFKNLEMRSKLLLRL